MLVAVTQQPLPSKVESYVNNYNINENIDVTTGSQLKQDESQAAVAPITTPLANLTVNVDNNIVGFTQTNQMVPEGSIEANNNTLSPNSKYDYDLRRRTALKWLQDGHVVNIKYSNGSSQENQVFKATEDKDGSTVFVWEGPPDDGKLGYLPVNSIVNIETDESGAIVVNVYDASKNIHALSFFSPNSPAEHLKLLANLSIIVS